MTPAENRLLLACMKLGAWSVLTDEQDATYVWLTDLLQGAGIVPGANRSPRLSEAELDRLTALIQAHGQAGLPLPPQRRDTRKPQDA